MTGDEGRPDLVRDTSYLVEVHLPVWAAHPAYWWTVRLPTRAASPRYIGSRRWTVERQFLPETLAAVIATFDVVEVARLGDGARLKAA